ncbi:hypothetical protein [Cryptosporangium phraense]|uniref:Uncharacterized protein n=1 Tax=Cryptosporangium phraense TaxID=2593070 RepID=A0A545AME8_9ACTN|nr:hypothetical protein [Cryptosporangium phraense]TQS42492.1 hypothetical protein FL583_24645 [Cryptosporangium phraense]
MATGLRTPAEYGFGLTIDEATYPIRMFGRSEDELRAKIEADFGRRSPKYHRCLDDERPAVRIEWGQVKQWSISTPELLRRREPAGVTPSSGS